MSQMSVEESRQALAEQVAQHDRIVFFGGAGVSTESGIPDFRSAHGLYNGKSYDGHRPEEIISHSYFERCPSVFYDFYCEKMIYLDAQPNQAHRKLAELEQQGKISAVVTQNIDGLHQKAGSKNVFELHGSVLRNHCTGCGTFYGVEDVVEGHAGVDASGAPSRFCDPTRPGVPICPACGGIIKPDVVLYEEPLDEPTIEGAVDAIEHADMIIVAGTSLNVYPAAGFLQYFRGDETVIVNLSSTPFDRNADLVIEQPVGQVFGW